MEIIDEWGKLISVIIAFIAMCFGIYRALKKKDRINPVFIKRSTNFIKDEINNVQHLTVTFRNQPTSNFTITNIAFWNAGKKTINLADVASSNTVKIQSRPGITIFDAILLKSSVPENKIQIQCKPAENMVEITFEYLDYNHGAAIRVLHSGQNSNDIDIVGTFKSHGSIVSFESGAKKVIMTEILESRPKNFMPKVDEKKSMFKVFLIVALILIGVGFFAPHFWVSLLIIIHGFLYVILGVAFRFATKTPKEFEFIEE